MKLTVFSLFLLGISHVALAENRSIGASPILKGIPEIIDGIIKNLISSLSAALPEPIKISKINLTMPYGNVASGVYAISDFVETGVKEYNITVCKSNIAAASLNVVLNIPSININTNYYSDLLFGSVVPMYGEGPMKNLFFQMALNDISTAGTEFWNIGTIGKDFIPEYRETRNWSRATFSIPIGSFDWKWKGGSKRNRDFSFPRRSSIHLKNLQFNLTSRFKLKILPPKLQIQNTSFVTTLGDATFDIHGMINNEAFSILVSQILDDTVDVFINTHTQLIAGIVSPIIETTLNKILDGKKSTHVYHEFNTHEMDFTSMFSELNEDDLREMRTLLLKNIMSHPKFANIFRV